jgi:riboflavin synthase
VFTGLISHVGEIVHVAESSAGRVLRVSAPWPDITIGESIALDGVCLTVTEAGNGAFSVAAVTTTLERTTLGSWARGRHVNLERALRAGDRLGGHLVQGHVDGVADVRSVTREGTALVLSLGLWEGAEALCVPQGSITVDGVSLTVYAMPAPRVVAVSIIEHTRAHTTLGERRAGDEVNVELDVIGKYVRQIAAPWTAVTHQLG